MTRMRNKKTTRAKKSNKRSFDKRVKDIVIDELKVELEEKHALIGGDTTNLPSPSIPAGNVSANANFIKLFPTIAQGDGQYNNRQGNEIRLKWLDISCLIAWNRQYDTGNDRLDFKDDHLGIRIMILKQKDNNDFMGALENFQGTKLLENGNIAVPGPSDFNGRTINLFQKINREQFTVRYDKVHYLDRAKAINPTIATNFATLRAPRPAHFKHRLTFGKRGLKLTFGDAASLTPTDFPYFMVMGYVSTTDLNAPNNSLLNYTYSSNAAYTDA